MRLLSLVLSAVCSLGCSQGVESLQGSVGGVFPVGPTETRLEAGWSFSFGGIYWLSERVGIHTELGIQRIGLSPSLRADIGPARDGVATILGIPVNAFIRLHGATSSGFYVLGGFGIYNRQLELDAPSSQPVLVGDSWAGVPAGAMPSEVLHTTRGGVNIGLGWEAPRAGGHFFMEVRYHRMFTRGLPTEFVPVLFGTRF